MFFWPLGGISKRAQTTSALSEVCRFPELHKEKKKGRKKSLSCPSIHRPADGVMTVTRQRIGIGCLADVVSRDFFRKGSFSMCFCSPQQF